ncbi:LacI family DNA-binding transcriptional regulator [Agreia sp. Leaf244]|uniref:LacI family DNA-binding transcriptional regulator n=1 Tax=Agreia sp. Leaf244 TaxID=1736305 RepID=UPI00191089E3|nr:LacI family DNA-binding transcriptional regulator [Agreia sp. Leaf244]
MDSQRPASPRATLARVAEHAGTSIPTVSKVLNGKTDVSHEMRARVLEAVHAVGYTRSIRRQPASGPGGSSAATDPTDPAGSITGLRSIDVVVGHLEGSWITRVLEGIEEEASDAGVDLTLSVARPDGSWIGRLLGRSTLGAIVVLVDMSPAELHALADAPVPVVIVDPGKRPPDGVSSVAATNWDGGRMAAEHLLALGHTRFGIIAGKPAHLYSSARVDGFTTALRSAGIVVLPELVAHGDWDRERARVESARMLASAGHRPTAIFACSDGMGLGVYDAALEAGLRIPDDLSVVGFDDLLEPAWATPPMTTIHQPIREMGAAAFGMLVQARRSSRSSMARQPGIELQTRLVTRASTSPPR